ncbi:peptide methionine sulfoxide reductase [Aliikangiella marina]|uniref:peptide-methionine (S)-S-oxide reductase n=1 Tax=Aliikangiella marina TaxID=1712262 RepID=A0A545TIZ4_9GAMM|nr:peptide-methionine (S)-S-oxide reductase [Aliikangiella marina]TQV77204.1 peptide methionine sulfoxide reductase [Aliikangiella marina]
MTLVVGLGGECHWCTEGIFQSLLGVTAVNQGWIKPRLSVEPSSQFREANSNFKILESDKADSTQPSFSEAIEVYFNPKIISLTTLIEIHLYTHASTANHSLRNRYRSAVYTYDEYQQQQATHILESLATRFDQPLVTRVLQFNEFKLNKNEYLNYFYQSPDKPFCQSYIHPKLRLLLTRFNDSVDTDKLQAAGIE